MGVYKEGKNWKVQVYYKDWQGNQKRKQKRGFRTKGEAKEWERDFLQQQSQGVDIEFGNFLEIYYKDMDVRLREHTMYTKRYIIDLKIRPYFEKKILNFHLLTPFPWGVSRMILSVVRGLCWPWSADRLLFHLIFCRK